MYLYESHLGGFYPTDEQLDNEDLYCETCGDYDWEIGEYNNKFDAWCLLMPRTSVFGTGGFSLDLVCSFITGIPREELEEYSDIEMLKEIELVVLAEEETENE